MSTRGDGEVRYITSEIVPWKCATHHTLNVTKSTVSAWENRRESPSFRLLPALSSALHTLLDTLIRNVVQHPERTGAETENSSIPRTVSERALLQRFRAMPRKQQRAILDLLVR